MVTAAGTSTASDVFADEPISADAKLHTIDTSSSHSIRGNGSHSAGKANASHKGFGDYGGSPLAHYWSQVSGGLIGPSDALFAPGFTKAKPPHAFANPAPLGLAGFAFNTFVLSLINLGTRSVTVPAIIIAPSLAYGGFIQLLAGMWEVASGNTFAAFAFASYGGFLIGLGIIFIPGGFQITEAYGGETWSFYTVVGFYVMAWFIFTFLLWLATLRSTFSFSFLLFIVWITFLLLAIGYIDNTGAYGSSSGTAMPNQKLVQAGGATGIVAAFNAWYVMLEGIQDDSNSFFRLPVLHFPWSVRDRPPAMMDADIEALEGNPEFDASKEE